MRRVPVLATLLAVAAVLGPAQLPAGAQDATPAAA